MDRAFLVESDFAVGRRVVDAFVAGGLPIAVAGWFKLADGTSFQLHVATPDVQVHGPLAVMRFMDAALDALAPIDIAPSEIVPENTTTSFAATLGDTLRVTHGVYRIGWRILGDAEIEAGVIYVSRPRAEVAPSPAPPVFDPARLAAAAG